MLCKKRTESDKPAWNRLESMPKKIFRKMSPSPEFVRNHKSLSLIAHQLDDPNLFHLNRLSVSRAFAVGLGVAVLPVYGHMIMAAALAIWFRANLAISILLVWISNPLTFALFLIAEYWLGANLLGVEADLSISDIHLANWRPLLEAIWKPVLLGSAVLSVVSAILGYTVVTLLWRWEVARRWKKRKKN